MFGGQFLNASGTYNQTFTSMAGCDSVVQLNLVVSDSLLINSESGVNGFCPGGTLRLGTSAFFPSSTFRWKLNGAVMGSNMYLDFQYLDNFGVKLQRAYR
jgi:hypothetical protein